MISVRSFVRPAIAALFISGGVQALKAPPQHADVAEPVVDPVAAELQRMGFNVDPRTLVVVNGAVQVGAGALLALGIMPRLAATALAGSLIPTTLAGHRFWETKDEERSEQRTHFFKNLAILGGLASTALDTGGRPSVFWTGRRAADRAAHSIAEQASRLADALPTSH
jgi:uncharacterized membrane protein YphA (DoxX/SURF4 family)